MSNYIFPDKKALQQKYLEMYGQQFLELNDLKIGDEVEMEFPYEILRTPYKSRSQSRYTESKMLKGVLKTDEFGILYAESYDDMPFYHLTSNNLSGRSRREWYKTVNKKSIIEFGTGFILKSNF